MQLHRLELCAIGPFADRVVVDFDTVGASGLFLLEGPTGAGKSTLIDAVVFAHLLAGGIGMAVYGRRHGWPAAACVLAADTSPSALRERLATDLAQVLEHAAEGAA